MSIELNGYTHDRSSSFRRRERFAAVLIAAGFLPAVSPLAHAQDTRLMLEEVLVTAQKRSESLSDVPISIAVETGETLEKKGITNLQALSNNTPSLYIQDGGRTSSVAIRGLGSPGLDSVESSVGLYIDGVYFGRSRLSRNPLFDMERVEILRGPQGTLYGRNTIAGAINMITAKPTDEFEARILLEAGNYDAHKVEAYVSGEIVDGLSGRIAVLDAERDGYLDNSADGPDGGGKDSQAYRGSLNWDATDSLSFALKYEHMDHRNTGSYAQLSGNPFNSPALAAIPNLDFEVDKNQQVSGQGINFLGDDVGGEFVTDAVVLRGLWEFGDGYSLTSITGWTDYEVESRDYITSSPIDTLTIAGLTEGVEYWSQEFRLASPSDKRFRFVTGAAIDKYDLVTDPSPQDTAILALGGQILPNFADGIGSSPEVEALFPGRAQNVADGFVVGAADGFTLLTPGGNGSDSNLTQEIETWSVFFEGTYEVNDQWHIVAGARYTEEENTTTLAKGTFYRNAAGQPWGGLPSGAEIADIAIANDPMLTQADAGLLNAVYSGTLASDIGGGRTVADIPLLIAAPGGTPIARPEPLEEDSFTPSLKVQYFASEDAMYYATIATGFKAGGFNSSNIQAFSEDDIFNNEDSVTLEIGGKLTLAEGAANFNFAIFRTEFDDLQVGSITPQGGSVVLNAGSSVSQGLEMDGTWRLTEAWTVGGAYAYLDSKYTDSEPLVCTGVERSLRIQAGETFASDSDCIMELDNLFGGEDSTLRAPEHSANLFAEYYAPLNDVIDLQTYIGVNYRDKTFTSIENFYETDAITLVDARIALYHGPGQWSVALQGNNLLDDDGLVLQQDNSGGAAKGIITTPRTFRLQVTKSF